MAHPPPPPGPPPEIAGPLGQGRDAFRLAVYHMRPLSVPNENGGNDLVRQYIYKSELYHTRREIRILQAEIKFFLERIGMLGLILSFTHWRIQIYSVLQRARATNPGGHEIFQPEPRGATEGGGAPEDSSDSRSSDF